MDQFINSLPKGVLAFLVISLGFGAMLIYDPPRTVCDSQLSNFRESQKKLLYSSTTPSGIVKPALIKELHDNCKNDNSPGGCFELFVNLRKLSVDLEAVPDECAAAAAAEPPVQAWLMKSLKLMVQLAWGDRAPASHLQKNGWYDASEIVLFCDLKRSATRIYGTEAIAQWREGLMTSLPQADTLNREQQWQKSLLSAPCDVYR